MLKKCLAILLISAIGLQSGREALIGVWYMLNKADITEHFCVNKNKKEYTCAGRCYLAKVLEGASDEQENIPVLPPMEERLTYIKTCTDLFKIKKPAINRNKRISFFYKIGYAFDPLFFVFHPPKQV
ncbi:MAG TPA: hypothetical protein ENJ95_05470 [Bacteroidetes bacterium]|nr:hypothetical protein [Bacteroidota bacterium]